MTKRSITLLGLACALSAAADNIAYLATTGDDTTGTLNNQWRPFQSLQAAVSALGTDGGTVSVNHGTYSFTTSEAPAAYASDKYTAGASCVVITNPVEIDGVFYFQNMLSDIRFFKYN